MWGIGRWSKLAINIIEDAFLGNGADMGGSDGKAEASSQAKKKAPECPEKTTTRRLPCDQKRES
jgi:hypothetical protein